MRSEGEIKMNKKRRELLSHNRKIKRKIGSYVLRMKEHKIELLQIIKKAKMLEEQIMTMGKVLAMEELRIKDDIEKLIGILNGVYDEEGL